MTNNLTHLHGSKLKETRSIKVYGGRLHSGGNYFLVQRSSPVVPPLLGGLALRPLPLSRFEGSQPPPPPSLFVGWSLRSNLWPARRDETKSFEASRRCMKLQNPPLLHSPFSFWRQQASRKSVTGESSAYKGLPKMHALTWDRCNHRQTYLHTSVRYNCQLRPGPQFPTRTVHRHCLLGDPLHCHKPCSILWANACRDRTWPTWSSRRCPNLANSQYRSSYTASKPSWSSFSVSLQTGSCAGLW